MGIVREPAVAGTFYPGNPETLAREVQKYLSVEAGPTPALAVVAPHAGYVYSGPVAGATYARVQVPDTVVVLCPNHTGLGARRSLWRAGAWALPGGEVAIDVDLAEQLEERVGLASDTLAHLHEHAIEVQLPFLRARNPKVRIVPICLAGLSPVECVAFGEGIAQVVAEAPGEVLLVASTDMSHYLPAEEAQRLDALAIERVEALDAAGLYETVRARDISMCGVIPTTVVLAAARSLGARAAQLVRYGNSGEASGDFERVVGYAGLVIPRA